MSADNLLEDQTSSATPGSPLPWFCSPALATAGAARVSEEDPAKRNHLLREQLDDSHQLTVDGVHFRVEANLENWVGQSPKEWRAQGLSPPPTAFESGAHFVRARALPTDCFLLQ